MIKYNQYKRIVYPQKRGAPNLKIRIFLVRNLKSHQEYQTAKCQSANSENSCQITKLLSNTIRSSDYKKEDGVVIYYKKIIFLIECVSKTEFLKHIKRKYKSNTKRG